MRLARTSWPGVELDSQICSRGQRGRRVWGKRRKVSLGKLYSLDSGELLVGIDYQVYDESIVGWWGELVFTEYRHINDGGRFVLELEDGRRGRCSLQKRVNRAVSGLPALYHYQFRGQGGLVPR
jgi:hypothetical protein